MGTTPRNFTPRRLVDDPNYKWGREVESRFSAVLLARNHTVIDTASITDPGVMGGPVIHSAEGNIIIPDLLGFAGHLGTLYEVKAKERPSWWRIGSYWEHGIDYSSLNEYRQAILAVPYPIYIVVWEDNSPIDPDLDRGCEPIGKWLIITLKSAIEHGRHREDWPGGKLRPHDRGRHGQGGWLWPRRWMTSELPAPVVIKSPDNQLSLF